MRGYAIRSAAISCAIILMGDEEYNILDVQAMATLERVIEKCKIDPQAVQDLQDNAPESLYQLIPESTLTVDMKRWTIVNHTQQSIREVADRMGWVQSQLDSVERTATQIELLQASLKEMREKVSNLTLQQSRANKSRDTSSGVLEMKDEIEMTTEMARILGIDLEMYGTELKALNTTLKKGSIEEFNKLQKDLIPKRSMVVVCKEAANLYHRRNEIQAKLDDMPRFLQG